ncbi:MAG: tail fiber protein [Actinomycetota bacterium]|nr:tail fiber protein [Actinomycetota bacterium]
MAEPFLGEVRMMGFAYPPKGWASCNGELLPIAQNEALFSVLGTTFGGDGETDFALPDFRGRVPIHAGNAHAVGEAKGSETVTLTERQMPSHTHTMWATDADADTADPRAAVLGATDAAFGSPYYSGTVTPLHPAAVREAGGSRPHANMQPYLALTFCIALEGIVPRRD